MITCDIGYLTKKNHTIKLYEVTKMKYSYNEFIQILGLLDTELAKTMYELYLDCLREMNKS